MMSIKVIYSAISLMNVIMMETVQVLHVEITLILVFSFSILRMIREFNNNEGENVNINFNWIMAN